jgi:hypothetical protein
MSNNYHACLTSLIDDVVLAEATRTQQSDGMLDESTSDVELSP